MDVDYIFIFIWIVLLLSYFNKKSKPDDYIVLFSLKTFTVYGLKYYFTLKLIPIALLLFYILFGWEELSLGFFILHIFVFLFTLLKVERRNTN
ncbi:MAG: hypothetical protein CMP76_03910 [Flavobacterium sp.]|nr:hypothetical protein [Flavobacterium sp.]|tara:strand:- start:58 stop:336 length:279 start_codon:yes stop_codon:yes gene_type:complete